MRYPRQVVTTYGLLHSVVVVSCLMSFDGMANLAARRGLCLGGNADAGETQVDWTPMPQAPQADIFFHVRVVMSIVLGLGLTRLLNGTSRFVQHPGRQAVYLVHLGWVVWTVLLLVHFWWWEFWLAATPRWTFELYLFVVAYVVLLFLLCTLLYPDDLDGYAGYEDYFLSRRRWFFGLLAATFVFDFVDTLLKGPEHYAAFHGEYLVRLPVCLMLCCVAMITQNRWFHGSFVLASLAYEVSWIFRLFDWLTPG